MYMIQGIPVMPGDVVRTTVRRREYTVLRAPEPITGYVTVDTTHTGKGWRYGERWREFRPNEELPAGVDNNTLGWYLPCTEMEFVRKAEHIIHEAVIFTP